MKKKNKQCLSLTRLTNKIFLHTNTKCVSPSETFRTSYPLFHIVVSEKRPVQNTLSASCYSTSVEFLAKGTFRSVSDLIERQTELDPSKLFSSVLLKDQDENSAQADWFWI